MVATVAVEPISTASAGLMDHRFRPAMGERTVLPDVTQKSAPAPRAGSQERQSRSSDRPAETPAEPQRDRSSDFAAAVIAGALPPQPQSMEELLRRIGSSEIPPESEARLKDLLA